MLGPILAAIIIILLIIYAAFPFLTTKGFKGWAGIALTSLILFTVIVTLFVILGQRKGQTITLRTPQTIEQEAKTKEQEKENLKEESNSTVKEQDSSQEEQSENNNISDEEALMILAKEYLEAEEAFKAQGYKDYQQKAAQQIIDRYDLDEEDWQAFLEDAAKYDLFNKAKEEMKK